jgi:hypothetical protein
MIDKTHAGPLVGDSTPASPSSRPASAPLALYDFNVEESNGTTTTVHGKLGDADGFLPLWFEIESDLGPVEVDSADALFLVALLIAMQEGRPLHVDAPVSSRLVYHANRYLGYLIHRIHGPSTRVPVTAATLATPTPRSGRGVCAGVSGGIDSFNLLQDHLFSPGTEVAPLNVLLFNSVGSHSDVDPTSIFNQRLQHVRQLADVIGLPLVVTKSNQSELLSSNFMQFESIRNATVPLLLQTIAYRFYHAASVTLDDLGAYPHDAVDIADPVILSLLSTERMDLVSTGADLTRIEKTARLPAIPYTRDFLYVCNYTPPHFANCGACMTKCLPTLYTMDLLEIRSNFEHLFDTEAYDAAYPLFLVNMINSNSMLMQQIREAATRRGASVPWRVQAAAWADRRAPLRQWVPPIVGREICKKFIMLN